MSISNKFTDLKFTKSISGYNCAEVDGFINDILPLIKEQEQLIMALKFKLAAFEEKHDEVAKQEQNVRKLLEAAKEEAEIIVGAAKETAKKLEHEAKVSSEVQLRAANSRATEIISSAESTAKITENEAKQNAEKIIRTADAEARSTIEKVVSYTEEEKRKLAELSAVCYNFETRFRTLVADTAKAFAEIKEQVPIKPAAETAKEKATEAPKAAKVEKIDTPKEEVKEKAEEPVSEKNEVFESDIVTDIEIVGGKPVVKKSSEPVKKHFYDTVTVLYDDDTKDDFEDIKDIMSRNKRRKSPTDFSE